jgi:beta-galactosidase/beta-glucuronidase
MLQIKVEPPLFYQACDRLGLMVMQDMPSMTNEFYDPNKDPDVLASDIQTDSEAGDCTTTLVANRRKDEILPEDQAEFGRQLAIMVEQHKSYPSIVAWVR